MSRIRWPIDSDAIIRTFTPDDANLPNPLSDCGRIGYWLVRVFEGQALVSRATLRDRHRRSDGTYGAEVIYGLLAHEWAS